jgi:DNA phosphorothioation-associated putative methyltransferase
MTFTDYQQAVENLPHGKRLPTARYVFTDSEHPLPEPLATLVSTIRLRFAPEGPHNLVKLHTQSFKISLLHYPRFFDEPHPALMEAVVIDLVTGQSKKLSYSGNDNPPILHRKEAMLPVGHAKSKEYASLSEEEEAHGLYRETSRIGFKHNWDKLLRERGLSYIGHRLIAEAKDEAAAAEETGPPIQVHRHRTAMSRSELSKPVREILNLGLLSPGQTFFDYGCGHGSDVRLLGTMGFKASGWDPVHSPDGLRRKAWVVNLGFVLNVIEDPTERIETLVAAWSLTEGVLIVSTMVEGQEGYFGIKRNLNDGIVTARSTFQKYFAQAELQMLIEESLEVDADAIGLGIFIVFRDHQARQAFLFSRIQRDVHSVVVHRRILRPPPMRKSRPGFAEIYLEHQALMDAFWLRIVTLGRLPSASEFGQLEELTEKLGKPQRIANLLMNHFGEDVVEDSRRDRVDDLLVYLALAQFRRAVPFGHLPDSLQRDIKALLGSYQAAQQRARDLLYSAGDPAVIEEASESLPFGFHTEDHFTVHRSLLDQLPPVLRLYVHCSSIIYGNPHDADLIKIHKHSGKVTLQFYDDFNGKMLPELQLRVKVNLRSLHAQIFDHSQPPHRQLMPFKERFLSPHDPCVPNLLRFSKKLCKLGFTPEVTANGVPPEAMAAALRRFPKSGGSNG